MWAFADGSPRSYVCVSWNCPVAGTGAALALLNSSSGPLGDRGSSAEQ